MDLEKQAAKLQKAIDESHFTVAVTGAGISLSSGGITFNRSNVKELMGLGSEDMLRNEPDKYYQLLDKAFLHSMFHGEPSVTHRALRKLEQDGKLQGIITTNVDCMHTIAGSENVAEIQGSLQINRCTKCYKRFDDYHIWGNGTVPRCDLCGDVIWTFPFYSHVGLHDGNVRKAQRWMAQADLIIITGANGNYSDAYFNCRKRTATIIQINPGHTWFDFTADLNIHAKADDIFKYLL
ncbi:MAG: NAD-dependent protein deacetylase [Clostridia bacterium]|nr:NAD-dependent protein deacetylase [Clostridia bacterium]